MVTETPWRGPRLHTRHYYHIKDRRCACIARTSLRVMIRYNTLLPGRVFTLTHLCRLSMLVCLDSSGLGTRAGRST